MIDTAVDELNEKSPITVSYNLLKTGRKFTHLELKFKPKEKNSDKTLKTAPYSVETIKPPYRTPNSKIQCHFEQIRQYFLTYQTSLTTQHLQIGLEIF